MRLTDARVAFWKNPNSKRTPLRGSLDSRLVEAEGIEPSSEKLLTGLSPGAEHL